MLPGCLVETSRTISSIPIDDPIYPGGAEKTGLDAGLVGIILDAPNTARPRQYLVSFVGGKTYWMFANEIQPYMGEKNV